jgi:hypothetical protein
MPNIITPPTPQLDEELFKFFWLEFIHNSKNTHTYQFFENTCSIGWKSQRSKDYKYFLEKMKKFVDKGDVEIEFYKGIKGDTYMKIIFI